VFGSVMGFATSPGLTLLGLWLLVVWLIPRLYGERREVKALRASKQAAQAQVAEMEAVIAASLETIAQLDRKLKAQSRRRTAHPVGHPHFRRVGLDAECPKFVAELVRREYRKRLHPDGKPPEQKAEAEARFKEAEAVFAEIWRKRGF
jgi:hypothetical protein